MKGIYVHIPFCNYKCNYCDFSTMTSQNNRIDDYFNLLFREIEMYESKSEKIDTLYIGGGTPNLVDEIKIEQTFQKLNKSFNLDLKEFTIECNPEFLTKNKVDLYKSIGINRVSLGIQTFDDTINRFLGRRHKVSDTLNAFNLLENKIDNISIDLIFGIPNQTIQSISNDLNYISKLRPQHVSWYNMILEPGTKFYKMFSETDRNDEKEYEMYMKICEGLNNYKHYEISNFAKNGKESLHNKIYWKDEHYYGFGMSSSGYLGNERYTNEYFYPKYKNKILKKEKPINFIEEIDESKNKFEYIITNLRLKEGLNVTKFEEIFGVNLLEKNKKLIEEWVNGDKIIFKNNSISFTDSGFFISNKFFVDICY
ncbi:radical SAM family heme chaperone HemW [uncultured Finegoldia sp.]|uniref:radical SAM family heme chaperone HemW n=1 Tax=uncultured Finegoldia sp. TaxID=328009 RepID=UPI002621AED5|nr:radical SAM family heme chaperone HemW [uncultured Finegoldia sp.]